MNAIQEYFRKVMQWGEEMRADEYGTDPRPCKLGKCPCLSACDEEGHCLSAWTSVSGEK